MSTVEQRSPEQLARAAQIAERDVLRARLAELEALLHDGGDHHDGAPAQHPLWQAIPDAMPAMIALLDGDGRILAVNQAWRVFGRANAGAADGAVGQNYLDVCASAGSLLVSEAEQADAGIRAVLAGELREYTLEYPCDTPDTRLWFQMMVAPLREAPGCVVMHVDITDRKLAEDSLRINEARLRALLDAEPECVKVVSVDGRLLSMNPAGLRMVQAREFVQVAGRPVGDLIHPEDRQAFRDLHARALEGANGHLQFRIIGLEGRERWMDTHSTPLHSADGSVEGVLSVTRDITGRRAADAQLASLQQLHRNILSSVAEGIHGIDLEGRVRFANPAAAVILGYPEEDIVGRQTHTVVHHHHADGRPYPAEQCPILKTLGDGVPRRVDDEVFFRLDGSAIPVEYVVAPVRGPDDAVQGAVVCFRDITERRASQAALARSEERFRLAARATDNAIWDWDLVSNTVTWSGGLEALFDSREDYLQLENDIWSTRIHPDDQQRITRGLERALAEGQHKWEEEYRFARPDGSYVSVIDRGFVMCDENGVAFRMIGGMTDVTRMRALEAQLRVSQRLEAVGQLTGGVAHDFNNLLTVVLGNAEILQERLPPASPEWELADMIMAAAQRGSSLTQRLLAFARRQALDTRPLRLGELVQGMRQMMRQVLGERVELSFHASPDDWVLGDAAQLENALLNLCINARDAMPDGGKLSIAVTAVTLAPTDIDPLSRSLPGRFVALEVLDTGTGIAPEVLPLVIEPFFTTKQKGKGTGLGLSMVYGLIKQSNGYMDIRSEPGHGTSVRIHLPWVAPPADAGTAEALSADAPVLVGGHEHVLLVEDDAMVRRYAVTQLQSLGYRVSEAQDSAEALRLLEGDRSIQLLVTDVMMPGLNGAQLADAARRLRPGLRVLFVSGYSEDALTSEGRLPVGVLLLPKPYPKAELARRVRQALS